MGALMARDFEKRGAATHEILVEAIVYGNNIPDNL